MSETAIWRRRNVNRRCNERIKVVIIERLKNGKVKVMADMPYGPTLKYVRARSLEETK